MALYERLVGATDAGVKVAGKIPISGFASVMAEFGRGALTGAEAQTTVASISRDDHNNPIPLTASEVTEAQTLLATIAGTAQAKLNRSIEINDKLMLAELGATGYNTPTQLKTKLGV